jgi:hypothetical protein
VRHALGDRAVVLWRGAPEHELARAARHGLFHERRWDAGDARLPVDLSPGLGERPQRVAVAETHAAAFKEAESLLDDEPPLCLRRPLEAHGHAFLLVSTLPDLTSRD